jgi:hypothetical protein
VAEERGSNWLGGFRRVLDDGIGELPDNLGEVRHYLRVAQDVVLHCVEVARGFDER